ncbi:hypothetical protein RRG08_026598 [Elysia crispata]|uniref:Ribosome biogenesis regulatory protein n=1 Tax=Elysia crispata TaxID=231223 RepID=A0AAE0ZF14_9GAST|nr:hypothetical protein RRG08_026598 [Elysia crispata]
MAESMAGGKQSLVDTVLSQTEDQQLRTTNVENEELIELDEGNLLAINENKTDTKDFKKKGENILLSLTRDATQALFNSLWKIPVEQKDGAYLITLPEQKTWMPREKPVPKKKAPTKWEEYAKSKGILNKKKSRMVWDDQSQQQYKPRWGYNHNDDMSKTGSVEVPGQCKFQESGWPPQEQPSKDHPIKGFGCCTQINCIHRKIYRQAFKEKPSKFTGKKRKFEASIGNLGNEKEKQLKVLDSVSKRTHTINV